MSGDRKLELFVTEKHALKDRGTNAFVSMVSLSASFGQVIIRNAFILNGGALFAGLAFLGAMSEPARETFATGFTIASVFFVLGISAAALSATSAYLNYQYAAFRWIPETTSAQVKLLEIYTPDLYENKKEEFDRDLADYEKEMTDWNNKINTSNKIGIGLGIAAYVSFVIGCLVTGGTIPSFGA